MAFGSRRTVLPFLGLPSPLAAICFLYEAWHFHTQDQIERLASQGSSGLAAPLTQ